MQNLRSPIGDAANRRKFRAHLDSKRSKAYRLHAEEVHKALKKWEQHLKSICTDPAPIFVENKVDLEGPPQVCYMCLCFSLPLFRPPVHTGNHIHYFKGRFSR